MSLAPDPSKQKRFDVVPVAQDDSFCFMLNFYSVG